MVKYILTAILILISSLPVSAKEYESSFGFSLDIPGHWLVMTKEELKKNPDLFDFSNKVFENVDKNIMQSVIAKIKSGQVEFYYNQNTRDGSFADNINVTKQIGQIPETDAQIQQTCNELPDLLSSYLGKRVRLYQCRLKEVKGKKALFLEFDGVVAGTRNIQYMIQASTSVQIMFTLTCKNSVLEGLRREFDQIIYSIKL